MKCAKKYPFAAVYHNRLKLGFQNESTFTGLPEERQFRLWIWQAVKNTYPAADIGLLLTDAETARIYNRDYRGKDYATNVLSFAHNEGEPSFFSDSQTLSGDLIICPEVVQREAEEQGKTLTAHFAHLTIHGTLHLMGYDHIEENDAEEMETLEIRLLNQLGFPNPY